MTSSSTSFSMTPSKAFRIGAKNYFLTYPHCSLSLSEALQQLQTLQTPTNKKFIRVSQEFHENGEPHLHVLIQFEGKYQCRNKRFFDLLSPNRSAHFHPNIQAAKSSTDVKKYIEKEGVFIDWGEFQIDSRSARGGKQDVQEVYAEAFNSGNKSQFLSIIKEKDPKFYLLQFHRLSSTADKIFASPPAPYVSKWDPNSFRIPDGLQQWAAECLSPEGAPKGHRCMSLILEGPSRTGKTEWARSLGPHNYLPGYLDFNRHVYSNDVKYNVIDGVDPKYLKKKHWKELIGAKYDWQTNPRYGKPIQIKGGIPCIVLCNPGKGASYKDFLDKDENKCLREWTLKNAWFQFISTPLYTISQETQTVRSSQAEAEVN